MGNAPSSSRGSTPPPEPLEPPRIPPRAHSPPPRDALALKRGQSLASLAQPATTTTSFPPSAPPPPPPPPNPPKPEVPARPEVLPELDVGDAMPGELEEPTEDQSDVLTDWPAARAAIERAIGPLRDRAEEIVRETRELRRERRALAEEVPVLHERKMTIYEDAESGPLGELRFPPGLERRDSETEVSAISHSSEPTTETLVEEPEQATEAPAEIFPEKVVEKLETHEFPEVDSISREEPGTVKELEVVPEKPDIGPESSQISSEEPEQEVMAFDEAQPSQELAPILQEVLLVSEERPIDQAPLISSDLLSSLEEASDVQSEQLSSSLEFPRPHTPHPTFDDLRVASPVPFPVTNDHEDQGYGTQDDEDRTTQASQRSPGKHVHWGGVEAQPAYERPQDEEDQAEEHSPPFSRLLLPAPQPTEPEQDVRPERATRLAVRRTIPPALQKPMRKIDQGVYTVTDVRWGMALDLSSADNRSPIAFGSHGWDQQQVSKLLVSFDLPGLARNLGVGKARLLAYAHYTVGVPLLRRRFCHQERQ
jgi:hypothetical protein